MIGEGGGVVKCCRLLHKTITTSIHINLYSSLYFIPLAIIIPESVSPNHMMAAAARGSVINALVPTQDGRSVSSDQMDAFIPTIELVYREIPLIKHTEGLNVNEESAKQYIRMALNVLLEAMDTARRVLSAYRVQAETSGTAGRARFFVPRDHLEYLVENRFTVPQIAEMIDVSPRTVHLETVSDTPARGTIHALI